MAPGGHEVAPAGASGCSVNSAVSGALGTATGQLSASCGLRPYLWSAAAAAPGVPVRVPCGSPGLGVHDPFSGVADCCLLDKPFAQAPFGSKALPEGFGVAVPSVAAAFETVAV